MQPDPTSPLDLDAIRARFVVTENLDDGTKEYVDSLFWSSRDVPNLLAALAEAQRERDELRSVAELSCGHCAEMRRELETMTYVAQQNKRHYAQQTEYAIQIAEQRDAARADAERMRPVLEAAAVYIRTPSLDLSRPHPAPREARALIEAVHAYQQAAAVDTYETQEGTDG